MVENAKGGLLIMKCTARKLLAAILAITLCVGLSAPAHAAINPYKTLEEKTRQAVAAAIKDGLIPPGTTIYDCAFSRDANGVTIVVQYKDKDGNWIDVATQKPATALKSSPTSSKELLTEEELAAYEAEVFDLVNEAREEEGLPALEHDDTLDKAAAIRAEELSELFSHTRPDGTGFYTVLGVEKNYNYAENGGSSGENPTDQMKGWMKSEGHRTNILDLNEKGYTKIGIGVFQADHGKMYWCQLFYRPI
jgi:uncharacterized protein YkwD